MRRYRRRLRILLLTLAIGLASVPFYRSIREKWTAIKVDVPPVESNAPLFVTPFEMRKDATITQNRDLSLYEFGGNCPENCSVNNSAEKRKCEADVKKGRDFVWKNWNAKKKSYVVIGGKYHIFIETDEEGKWHIAVRSIARTYAWGNWIDEEDIRSLEFWPDSENGKKLNRNNLRLWFFNWEDYGTFSF